MLISIAVIAVIVLWVCLHLRAVRRNLGDAQPEAPRGFSFARFIDALNSIGNLWTAGTWSPDRSARTLVRSAYAKDHMVFAEGKLIRVPLCFSRDCRVFIEGVYVNKRCLEALEYDDGIVVAKCYLKRDRDYVISRDRKTVLKEAIIGRGHIFVPGERYHGELVSGKLINRMRHV